MEELKQKAEDLVDHVEELADTAYKLALVTVTQKATSIVSNAVLLIATAVLGFMILLFLGIAFSIWMGQLLSNPVAGFLIGSALFLLILLLIAMLRKKIIFPFIRNKIISKVYE